jgi:hypothetical protein
MDWLRSEDLKEEKNVTTPVTIIAGGGLLHFGVATGSKLRGVWRRARS